jgi:uncharacterized protein (DUF2249 family)
VPITRWKRKPVKLTVVAPHNPDPLIHELRRLYEEGYVEINLQQERFTNRWRIEAVKYVQVEE